MLQNTKKSLSKKLSKKGFTLMEMLIVVAIIAVLVAIAIPTFNSQLTKAKNGTDVANIRSAYALYKTSQMTNASPVDGTNLTSATATTTWYYQTNGDFATATDTAYKLKTAIAAGDVASAPDFTGAVGNMITITYTAASGSTAAAWSFGASASK